MSGGKATYINDAKVVLVFLKPNILSRFDFPKAIINDKNHFKESCEAQKEGLESLPR